MQALRQACIERLEIDFFCNNLQTERTGYHYIYQICMKLCEVVIVATDAGVTRHNRHRQVLTIGRYTGSPWRTVSQQFTITAVGGSSYR